MKNSKMIYMFIYCIASIIDSTNSTNNNIILPITEKETSLELMNNNESCHETCDKEVTVTSKKKTVKKKLIPLDILLIDKLEDREMYYRKFASLESKDKKINSQRKIIPLDQLLKDELYLEGSDLINSNKKDRNFKSKSTLINRILKAKKVNLKRRTQKKNRNLIFKASSKKLLFINNKKGKNVSKKKINDIKQETELKDENGEIKYNTLVKVDYKDNNKINVSKSNLKHLVSNQKISNDLLTDQIELTDFELEELDKFKINNNNHILCKQSVIKLLLDINELNNQNLSDQNFVNFSKDQVPNNSKFNTKNVEELYEIIEKNIVADSMESNSNNNNSANNQMDNFKRNIDITNNNTLQVQSLNELVEFKIKSTQNSEQIQIEEPKIEKSKFITTSGICILNKEESLNISDNKPIIKNDEYSNGPNQLSNDQPVKTNSEASASTQTISSNEFKPTFKNICKFLNNRNNSQLSKINKRKLKYVKQIFPRVSNPESKLANFRREKHCNLKFKIVFKNSNIKEISSEDRNSFNIKKKY